MVSDQNSYILAGSCSFYEGSLISMARGVSIIYGLAALLFPG